MSDDVRGAPGDALRHELAELNAANEVLAEKVGSKRTAYALKEAGFDPTSGPGKAIAQLYDGDPDPEAIREFAAAEFGFQPAPTGDDVPVTPEQQRAQGEDRLRMISAGVLPVRDLTDNDKIAQAEAAGDWQTVGRLNAQKLQRLRRGIPEYGGMQ